MYKLFGISVNKCGCHFGVQMASYSAQIQQLHSAERDSLVAQMRELQQTFDTMRAEQKEQVQTVLGCCMEPPYLSGYWDAIILLGTRHKYASFD